jgi:hypothetical protein
MVMDLSEILAAIDEELERLKRAKALLEETLEEPAPRAKRSRPKRVHKKAHKKAKNGGGHRRTGRAPGGGTEDGGYGFSRE